MDYIVDIHRNANLVLIHNVNPILVESWSLYDKRPSVGTVVLRPVASIFCVENGILWRERGNNEYDT